MINKPTLIPISTLWNSFCLIRANINKMLIALLSNIRLISELFVISYNSNRTILAIIFFLD